MDNLDFVLNDKFFEYSEKMKVVHEQLKIHEADLKEFYNKHKERTVELKEEAMAIQKEWDDYKKDCEVE